MMAVVLVGDVDCDLHLLLLLLRCLRCPEVCRWVQVGELAMILIHQKSNRRHHRLQILMLELELVVVEVRQSHGRCWVNRILAQ